MSSSDDWIVYRRLPENRPCPRCGEDCYFEVVQGPHLEASCGPICYSRIDDGRK